jgi:tetratricopeptide (TPR) repeat protein
MTVLDGRESYLRTIAQLTNERTVAKPIVAALCASGRNIWDIDIAPAWRTAGFVQELTAAANTAVDSDPRSALALAQLALAIATSISSGAYPAPIQAQIEGAAWKEIGLAHYYMSEYDASLRAYDSSIRAFATANGLAHDEAVVEFARAIVFVDLDRYDEALGILSKVEPLFVSFGDRKHVVQVKTLRGNLCLRLHRWQDAVPIYENALAEVPADDLHTRSVLLANLGEALAELGRFNHAALMLHDARQTFAGLGMTIEATRCEWKLGRLLIQTGGYSKAVAMLVRIRGFFLEKGLPEEAGMAGLDLVDASIASGATDDVHALVSQILNEFTAANLNSRALTALAYLRDVLPTTPKPATAVRHVRHYLDRLQKEPALVFLPLPE